MSFGGPEVVCGNHFIFSINELVIPFRVMWLDKQGALVSRKRLSFH